MIAIKTVNYYKILIGYQIVVKTCANSKSFARIGDHARQQCNETIFTNPTQARNKLYTDITPVYPNRIPAAADRTMIKIGLNFLYRSRNNATAKMPRLT